MLKTEAVAHQSRANESLAFITEGKDLQIYQLPKTTLALTAI